MGRVLLSAMAGLGKGMAQTGEFMFEDLKQQKLQQYAMARQQRAQAHDAGMQEARINAQMDESEADRTFQMKQSKTDHQRALELLQARLQEGEGLTANQRDARAMVDAGFVPDEAAAWGVLKGDAPTVSDALQLAMRMARDQEYYGPAQGESEKSTQEFFQQAMQMLREPARGSAEGSDAQGPPGEIPPAAIDYLKGNEAEDVRRQFDLKYGEGAASRILGR